MGGILKIVAQRLALGVVTLFVVSIVIFASVSALPGDFAQQLLGQGATDDAVDSIRADLGLDRSAFTRYVEWLGGAVRGDFGVSYAQVRFEAYAGENAGSGLGNVVEQITPRFMNTLFLAGVTACIAVPISLILGILAALYRNSAFDRFTNVFTLSSISSPEFFLAYILVLFLAMINPIFPAVSLLEDNMTFWDRLYQTILPALTLTLVVTAHMLRMTRAAIINLLASPYIEMARLKGISPLRVIVVHAFPNALAPIINVIALNLAYLITGVVVIEAVFIYNGIGKLFVDSVINRDIPVVQACCLIFATAYILLNLLADVLSIISNPRLRHPK